jgi:CheY-like chemotaxis protein
MVVEDDPTVADVVARYLAREGYRVEAIAGGATALERAIASPPDGMVLDLMLPGLDGLEVCWRVRAVAPVAIVMLTARGDESDRVVGLEHRPDPGQPVRVGQRPPIHPGSPAGGPDQAEQHAQGGGLAGAVGSEEPGDRARLLSTGSR